MTYEEISALIIRESDNIVYLSDPQTYEVIFLNRAALHMLGDPPPEVWRKLPCYKLIQGKDAPCEFCTNHKLTRDSFYGWDHYNEKLKRFMYKRNKLVELEGRLVRLEIATDNTEKELMFQRLEHNLEMETTLLKCIQTLSQHLDLEAAINSLLEIIGGYYHAQRAYIFECDYEQGLLVNTYEWCEPGVAPMIQNLKALPLAAADRWMDAFRAKGEFFISALDKNVDKQSDEYAILEPQGIYSLMAAPLKDGETIAGFIGVDNPEANVKEMLLLRSVAYFVMDDILKRRLNAALKLLSYTDALTDLWNRRKYVEALQSLEAAPPSVLGIIYVDINGLKIANDTCGHEYGDYLIRHTADILRELFQERVYRVGGDEFVVLCTDLASGAFQAKVNALRTMIREDEEFDVSVGVKWGESGADVTRQVVSADELMYVEKQRYYSTRLTGRGSHRSNLSKELVQEIQNGRFVVYLQPKICIQTGELCGAEALVRRLDDQGHCIPPVQFIPRYEAEGIIRHVDFFMLNQVCALLRNWSRQGWHPIRVAVNLSRLTLMEQDVASELAAVCASYGVSPRNIAIEVTESAGIMGIRELRGLVSVLKGKGFSISLDDFGAEYSNLAILADLEFNEVKLDKSLIDELEINRRSRVVTSHAIGLCRELDQITSVAEGIETPGQLEILASMRCEVGQGYHFDTPLPVSAFEEKYLRKLAYP